MIGDLRETAQLFDRRFVFNALLPVALWGAGLVVVVAASSGRLRNGASALGELDGVGRLLAAALAFALAWMLAAIMSSQWRNLARLYEGYPLVRIWSRLPLAPDRCPGLRRHRLRQHRAMAGDGDLYFGYAVPHGDDPDILPTRFGNTLRAAERYPLHRYGADAIVLWPRLYPNLPDDFRADYGQAVEDYEFSLVMSFLAAIGSVVAATSLIYWRHGVVTYALVLGGGWTVSYAFYRAACTSAQGWGELFRTAFDLYRDRLTALFPGLGTISDERERFDVLVGLILEGAPPPTSTSTSTSTSASTP